MISKEFSEKEPNLGSLIFYNQWVGRPPFGYRPPIRSIFGRSIYFHYDGAIFEITYCPIISINHAHPLSARLKKVRQFRTTHVIPRSRHHVIFCLDTQPSADDVRIFFNPNDCNCCCKCAPISHHDNDKSFVLVQRITSNNHVWLNLKINAWSALNPSPNLKSKRTRSYYSSVDCYPIASFHVHILRPIIVEFFISQKGRIANCHTGVVLDFVSDVGTGAGRSAQETPEISFPDRKRAS